MCRRCRAGPRGALRWLGLDHDGPDRNGNKLLKGTLDSVPTERPDPTPRAPPGHLGIYLDNLGRPLFSERT
jgi:hypothetical protein